MANDIRYILSIFTPPYIIFAYFHNPKNQFSFVVAQIVLFCLLADDRSQSLTFFFSFCSIFKETNCEGEENLMDFIGKLQ